MSSSIQAQNQAFITSQLVDIADRSVEHARAAREARERRLEEQEANRARIEAERERQKAIQERIERADAEKLVLRLAAEADAIAKDEIWKQAEARDEHRGLDLRA